MRAGRAPLSCREAEPVVFDGDERGSVEDMIAAAVGRAVEDGDPMPSYVTAADATLVYRALVAGGIREGDIDVGHDAMGGIAITVGDSSAHAWLAFRNDGGRSIGYTEPGKGRTVRMPPLDRIAADVLAFLVAARGEA